MEGFDPETTRTVHASAGNNNNNNLASQEPPQNRRGNIAHHLNTAPSLSNQPLLHNATALPNQDNTSTHQPQQPENKAYLMSVLQALRNKQTTEGSAGISSLFGTSPPKTTGSMTPASRERGGTEAAGRSCRGGSVSSSEYGSSSKKMRCLSEADDEAAGLSDGGASGVSRPPSSNTASTYIAQLSCDIARNALQSESPSSLSSNSSLSATSSPVHRDPPTRQQAGHKHQGKMTSTAIQTAPLVQREDSIFDSAHCVMLQELPPPPLPRPSQPAPAHLHTKARRKHHNKPDPYHSEDSSAGEADLGGAWAGLRGTSRPYAAGQGTTASDEEDDEDSCPAEDASMSCDGQQDVKPIFDTSHMTVEEILQFIHPPELSPHIPDNEELKNFLDPEEIGHLNYLIKCFTDAIFAVALPEGSVGKNSILPVDFLDVYCCCVMRVYILLFKNLDFTNLLLSDQEALFESGVLKALLCMSFFVFKENGNCWRIPNNVNELNPVVLKLTDLNQILPHNLLQQTLAINIASTKLKFDWPMGMLCICAFFYTPIDVEIQQIDKIDKLRDRYMEILLKYLKWKHGSSNAYLIYPEILKLMDAIVKHCRKVENLTLRLKDEEVAAFESRLQSLNTTVGDNMDNNKEGLLVDASDSLQSGVSFAKINRRISLSVQFNMTNCVFGSGVEMQHCAAVPTASMYYSNQPLESEEAKSRREVEALLIRKFLQSKQQELPQASPKDDTDHREGSDLDEGSPVHRVSNMKLLAIRRLLLDLSRKEQMPASPEPLGLSPARDPLDDTPNSPRLPPLPAALPLQVVQHKLYQANTLAVAVQQQHLANFAKSLAYRTPAAKAHLMDPSPDTDDTNAAIDLSQPRRESPASNLFASSTVAPSIPPSPRPPSTLPRMPALKPLSLAPGRPSPPPAAPYRDDPSTAGSSGDRVLAARGELLQALGSSASSGDHRPSSQLSVRQIERLLESLGQSKYSDKGNL